MGETLDARINFLQRQLHAIVEATRQAQARGDTAGLEALGALYKKVNADIEALKADAKAADSPSAFMLALDGLSDEAIKTATVLRDAGVTVVTGAASLVKYLPIILFGALVIVGLIYAGKLRKDLK